MPKYGVFVTRCGYIEVEADSYEAAERFVDHDAKYDDISWDEDWFVDTDSTQLVEESE